MAIRIPTTIPTAAAPISPRTSAILPYIVAAPFFREYLDTTVIATALPEMARSFSVGPNDVSMGMTAYMLTLAVFIPISGWVADRLGSRTVYGGALVLFTLASVLCGLSTGLTAFTAARVLQGIGGALMVPVGRMIVVRNTEKSRLMNAISTITWPAIVAPVVGPTVGGFITTYASWHWVFFLNIPFGCLALIAIARVVPNQRGGKGRPLDLVGFLLSGTALISLLYGTELASRQGSSFVTAVGFMSMGILIGIGTIRYLLSARHPLLDLSALGLPTFAVTVLWGSATRIGIEAVPYLSPLLLQLGFGLSAFHAGLLLLATAVGNLGMKVFTTRILNRFGFRTVATVNVSVAALAIAAFALLIPASPLALILGVLFVYGLTRSMQFTTLATLAYADVSDAKTAAASTLWSVAQQMTIGMGIAFGAVCLRVSAYVAAHSAGGAGNHPLASEFSVTDFHWAFAAAGLLVLCSVVGYHRLPRDAGLLLSNKKGAI
jgi:EmrB/QacA subfamily drug resistance transporter